MIQLAKSYWITTHCLHIPLETFQDHRSYIQEHSNPMHDDNENFSKDKRKHNNADSDDDLAMMMTQKQQEYKLYTSLFHLSLQIGGV